jgi:hypothetical protein
MFQLAVGMYWPGARAAPMASPPPGTVVEHCPDHFARLAPGAHANPTAPAASTYARDLLKKHDCCSTPGCQCHGAFTAVSTELTVPGSIAVAAWVLPGAQAPAADWRSDESLRPPIA